MAGAIHFFELHGHWFAHVVQWSRKRANEEESPQALQNCSGKLAKAEQLDVKHDCRLGRNEAGESLGTVGGIRGHCDLCTLPETHLRDAFVPALDSLATPQAELEGFAALPGAVELGTISGQHPNVVH